MRLGWIMIVVACGAVLSAGVASADTRYVSDQLVITLREGMSNKYRVIKTLKTDTAMEVLAEQDNYLYVQLTDGTKGYVLKQYISKKTPNSQRVKQLVDELAALQASQSQQAQLTEQVQSEAAMLRNQLNEANSALTLNEELLNNTKNELNELQIKAENVVLIDEERQRLKTELSAVNDELESLRHDNNEMLKTAMIKWFVAGAGVLFVGWVAGKFSRKKKRGLGSY
ncbi:MAG: TIGR04211 family SH3 domain-containing protein [Desulfuromonas sp.]|nr:TIGR04211 family SH3 domain-containing protein [Desulfuromonas sp.]